MVIPRGSFNFIPQTFAVLWVSEHFTHSGITRESLKNWHNSGSCVPPLLSYKKRSVTWKSRVMSTSWEARVPGFRRDCSRLLPRRGATAHPTVCAQLLQTRITCCAWAPPHWKRMKHRGIKFGAGCSYRRPPTRCNLLRPAVLFNHFRCTAAAFLA